jgi:hypothetical protein
VSLRFVTRAVRAAKSKLRRNSQMIRPIVRKCSREKPHFAAGGGQPSGPWLLDQCRRTDKSWAKETFTIVTTKFSTFVTVYLSQIVSRKTERPATPVGRLHILIHLTFLSMARSRFAQLRIALPAAPLAVDVNKMSARKERACLPSCERYERLSRGPQFHISRAAGADFHSLHQMPPKVLKSPRSGKAYSERDFHDEVTLKLPRRLQT